jgi:hypothetical protein
VSKIREELCITELNVVESAILRELKQGRMELSAKGFELAKNPE